MIRRKMRLNPIQYQWKAERYPGLRVRILTYWTRTHARHVERLKSYAAPTTTTGYYDSKYAGLRCIHTHEGAWNANTGNGYFGGLQMDYSFMSTYGPTYLRSYGTADKWPATIQLAVAYKAVQSRGYSPWPNTAAMCGLL